MKNKLHRSRSVTFRASPEEYESLQRSSLLSGARSISEFARSVACRDNSDEIDPSEAARLDSTLENLHRTVAELHQKIEYLTEILVKKDE